MHEPEDQQVDPRPGLAHGAVEVQRADWLAWSLQLVFGAFVGAAAGAMLAFARPRGWFRYDSDITDYSRPKLWFIAGLTLLVAGLASRAGDRMWFGSFMKMYEPRNSPASRRASLAICVAGLGLMTWGLISASRILFR